MTSFQYLLFLVLLLLAGALVTLLQLFWTYIVRKVYSINNTSSKVWLSFMIKVVPFFNILYTQSWCNHYYNFSIAIVHACMLWLWKMCTAWLIYMHICVLKFCYRKISPLQHAFVRSNKIIESAIINVSRVTSPRISLFSCSMQNHNGLKYKLANRLHCMQLGSCIPHSSDTFAAPVNLMLHTFPTSFIVASQLLDFSIIWLHAQLVSKHWSISGSSNIANKYV